MVTACGYYHPTAQAHRSDFQGNDGVLWQLFDSQQLFLLCAMLFTVGVQLYSACQKVYNSVLIKTVFTENVQNVVNSKGNLRTSWILLIPQISIVRT